MDLVTISVGIAAIGYGMYTAWARRSQPANFWKLEPMKNFWGERGGLAVHFVGYTLIPIVVGILFVLSGLRGVSLF